MNWQTVFLIFAVIAIILQFIALYVALFEPGLDYRINVKHTARLDSPQFLHTLEALIDAKVYRDCRWQVHTNGENYYEAELAAISRAKESVNLEAYIFKKGRVGERFIEALTERAQAGVKVKLVVDAIGSFTSWRRFFKPLTDAGGEIFYYHPFDVHTIQRINNRTHRELITIDGRAGFIGGSGFADHWLYPPDEKHPRWRDTMVYIEGEIVTGLQSTFVENWLESSGEILNGNYFPCGGDDDNGGVTAEINKSNDEAPAAMIINSSPSAGRSTRARILYGSLIATANESIYITTPYFLPDKGARDEMVRAVKERHVKIKIVVPGKNIDHQFVRMSSRRLYGDLLAAGAEIYEFQPGMIHAKSFIVDNLWSVVGSTNLDNRSFGLNDEVNLAVRDKHLAARLTEDFERDVSVSQRVELDEWRNRPLWEKAYEQVGRLLERQQ